MSVYNGTKGFNRKETILDIYGKWSGRERQAKGGPGNVLPFVGVTPFFSTAPMTLYLHGSQKGSVEEAVTKLR